MYYYVHPFYCCLHPLNLSPSPFHHPFPSTYLHSNQKQKLQRRSSSNPSSCEIHTVAASQALLDRHPLGQPAPLRYHPQVPPTTANRLVSSLFANSAQPKNTAAPKCPRPPRTATGCDPFLCSVLQSHEPPPLTSPSFGFPHRDELSHQCL